MCVCCVCVCWCVCVVCVCWFVCVRESERPCLCVRLRAYVYHRMCVCGNCVHMYITECACAVMCVSACLLVSASVIFSARYLSATFSSNCLKTSERSFTNGRHLRSWLPKCRNEKTIYFQNN